MNYSRVWMDLVVKALNQFLIWPLQVWVNSQWKTPWPEISRDKHFRLNWCKWPRESILLLLYNLTMDKRLVDYGECIK